MLTFFNRPLVRVSMGVAALLALLLMVAGPVFAHSELRSITPADGSTIDELPSEVVLTFTADVIGEFTKVQVTGPDGAALALDPPTSTGNTVTQPLPPLVPGLHTVTYRIVSADSHPVSGTSTFTVVQTAAPSASPSPAPTEASSSPAASTTPATPSPTSSATASPGSGSGNGNPIDSTVLLVLLAAGLLGLFAWTARRHARRTN